MVFARYPKELIDQLFTSECQRLPSFNMRHRSEAEHRMPIVMMVMKVREGQDQKSKILTNYEGSEYERLGLRKILNSEKNW